MKKNFADAVWAASTIAALLAGITVASAQGYGADRGHRGGTPNRGGDHMGGAPSMGGGHVGGGPSMGGSSNMGTRSMPSGPMHQGTVGGHSQSWGGGSGGRQFGKSRELRGHAFGQERRDLGRNLGEQRRMYGQSPGIRERSGSQMGEVRERGRDFGAAERGRGLGEARGLHGRELGTVGHGRGYGFAHAGSGRFALSSEQRSRIHEVALHRGFISRYRVSDVDFDVAVGVRVPRWFHIFWVPEEIVLIEPAFEGYRCFVYEDELVIVDPHTLEIIAIFPV
jgi:hypothetical protein